MDVPLTPIHVELRQRHPFPSAAEAAGVGLLRSAEIVRRAVAAAIGAHGITYQQYNVLRILRGAHPEPLPTLEIAARMIEATPGITRLLDRLEAKQLVLRRRCDQDRRQVHCRISEGGLTLLAELDAPARGALAQGFARLGEEATRSLGELLDRVRQSFRSSKAD